VPYTTTNKHFDADDKCVAFDVTTIHTKSLTFNAFDHLDAEGESNGAHCALLVHNIDTVTASMFTTGEDFNVTLRVQGDGPTTSIALWGVTADMLRAALDAIVDYTPAAEVQ
jgi:hypothetical protein